MDRFHIMQAMNKAIDEVRTEEAHRLVSDGYEPVLKRARWCLLKRPENLTKKQTVKLAELLKYNLRSVRSVPVREEFQRFWAYNSTRVGGASSCASGTGRTMRSRIEPMKKVARSIRSHETIDPELVPGSGEDLGRGSDEGLNNKLKLTTRKSYGFRTARCCETGPIAQPWSAP